MENVLSTKAVQTQATLSHQALTGLTLDGWSMVMLQEQEWSMWLLDVAVRAEDNL